MQKVTIKIDPLGNSKVEAHGFDGDSCVEATKKIEEALGSESDFAPKYEYYMNNENEENHEEVNL